MLQAILFDFNGIICDDEPNHLAVLQKVLAEEGIRISVDEYFSTYLGRDDKDCFRLAFERAGKLIHGEMIASLIRRKSVYYLESIEKDLKIFPGVISFIQQAHQRYELAIASGALRREIEWVLQRLSLRDRFRCIISSEDVERGKPDPSIFLKALEGINRWRDPCEPILPKNCLVIEDSQSGVKAALAAGMKCLAVTNSFPPSQLTAAHQLISSLEIRPAALQTLFSS